MALQKKLMCFNTQDGFDAQLNDGNIQDYSIVFIKDTQRIWTHGVYFSSLKEVMDALTQSDENLDALKTELTELIDTASQTAQDNLESAVSDLESSISDTAETAQSNLETAVSELEEKIAESESRTTYTAGDNISISDENVISTTGIYTSTEVDSMFTDVNSTIESTKSELESSISQTAETAQSNLESAVSELESSISDTASTAQSNLETAVSELEEKIAESESKTTYTAGDNISISDENVISTSGVYTSEETDSAIEEATKINNFYYDGNQGVTLQIGSQSVTLPLGYAPVVHENNAGTSGYYIIAAIKLTQQYQNAPFKFLVEQRGRTGGILTFLPTNSAAIENTDISKFIYEGDMTEAYILRTTSETEAVFDIYMRKSEAYDSIGVTLLGFDTRNSSITLNNYVDITYPGTFVTALPSGCVQAEEYVSKTVQELRDEIETLLPTKQSYCLMVRDYGDADPEAKMFYGSQDAIKAIGNHMRMAAIRGQGDYKLLAPNRITLSEDGEEIAIDGSDGDILVATDATIYLYAEKIEAEDGALEIFGLGLTPLTLFGKEAIGYEPFAFACDSCVYAQLTSSNTDHIPVDDVRSQLHCIYNENIAGYSAATTAFFKETYKANGNGFANGSYNTTNTILRAQAKNEDANTNYPYMGLYYRFLEIWLAALRCELGTMDGSAQDLLGCGVSSSLTASTSTFADEAISANCGLRLIDSIGTTLTITNLNQSILQLTSTSDAAYVAYGVDGTQAFYSSLPLMTPQRVIDRIVASGNLGYINDASNVFDEDGNVYTNIDLNTGEGMEAAKRYFVVRDCPGAESFSDGVMTGVINCYFKLSFADGVYRSNGTDLTGGTLIVKLSTMLYRGMSWATGHWNWMQGFHYVIHTLEDESRYVTAIYQRDPHKIEPWINGMTYTGLDSDGDTDWEKCGYDKCDDQLVYEAGWMKNSNPSISLFYYPDSGGAQHTYVCAYTWRNNSYSGNLDPGYRSVNASAFGGAGNSTPAASGSLVGYNSVASSNTGFAPVFALLDYMTVS